MHIKNIILLPFLTQTVRINSFQEFVFKIYIKIPVLTRIFVKLLRPLGWCQNILTVTYTIASFDCCATISSWLPPFPPPTRWCRNEPAMIVGLHSCPNILKIWQVNKFCIYMWVLMLLLYDYDQSLNLIILLTLLVHRASFEPLPGSLC